MAIKNPGFDILSRKPGTKVKANLSAITYNPSGSKDPSESETGSASVRYGAINSKKANLQKIYRKYKEKKVEAARLEPYIQ